MPLFAQDLIHKFELGAGNRLLKIALAFIAVIALALFYNLAAFRNFATSEAMDAAQLARNISQGKGFTTDFIRPFSIYLLKKRAAIADTNLTQPIGQLGSGDIASSNAMGWAAAWEKSPDLSNPPVYPLLLAGLLKVSGVGSPDVRAQPSFTTYGPEVWIAGFNQLLLLVCACLVFLLARRLFDAPVAWISAAVFVGTDLFWRYSVSGLPTLWLTLLVLLVFLLLARLDANIRNPAGANRGVILIAATLGVLAGMAGLTRYALLLLIVPLVIYLATLPSPQPRPSLHTKSKDDAAGSRHVPTGAGLALSAALAFLALVIPWLARNHSVSGALFGTAAYAALQDTPQFPGDTLFRSLNPDFGLVTTSHIARKVLVNLRETILQLPQLGGSWVAALFLVGLLMPFRNVVTGRIRLLLVSLVGILLLVQAALMSGEASAEVKSTDYAIIVAPVAFIFGVSLLFNLLDQFAGLAARYTVLTLFFILACAPLILTFAAPPYSPVAFPPYYPPWLQDKARYVARDDWMMSDIPWAIAWYGDTKSVWLSLKHGDSNVRAANDFYSLNELKLLRGLHLTAHTLKTLDTAAIARWRQTEGADQDWELFRAGIQAVGKALSPSGNQNQAALDPLMDVYALAEKHWVRGAGQDWESFVLGIFVMREVPTGFPLKTAPEGLVPEIFLTDSERPAQKTIKPSEQARKP